MPLEKINDSKRQEPNKKSKKPEKNPKNQKLLILTQAIRGGGGLQNLLSQFLHDLFMVFLMRVTGVKAGEIRDVVEEMGMGGVEGSLDDASVGVHWVRVDFFGLGLGILK